MFQLLSLALCACLALTPPASGLGAARHSTTHTRGLAMPAPASGNFVARNYTHSLQSQSRPLLRGSPPSGSRPVWPELANVAPRRAAAAQSHMKRAVAITAGGYHSCALLPDGRAVCFGVGSDGQLGTDSTADVGNAPSSPTAGGVVKAPAAGKIVSISAGGFHTCAVLADGRALCFGTGSSGRLGTDDSADVGNSLGSPTANGIVRVPLHARVLSISAGYAHTCAVLDDGRALCFGAGSSGQLGQDIPVDVGDGSGYLTASGIVKVPPSVKFVSISAGWFHTCGVLADGRGLCFGQNSGRLGIDSSSSVSSEPSRPVMLGIVKAPASALVVAISAGGDHSCAVLLDGRAICFGSGSNGQLGSDSGDTIGSDPASPTASGIVKVPANSVVVSISAGYAHTCAVLADGRALCFGQGQYGKLGSNGTTDIGSSSSAPTASGIVYTPSAAKVVSISAGDEHSCAILEDGRALCFGLGTSGQLGSDSASNIGDSPSSPAAAGVAKLPVSDFSLMALAARSSTCAITASRTATCWGSNEFGQLGLGIIDPSYALGDDELPANTTGIHMPSDAIHVASGPEHTCALLSGGGLSCWGNSAEGRTGYGNASVTPGLTSTPREQGLLGARTRYELLDVALGEGHTCALYQDAASCRARSVVCWGRNDAGQLGTGDGDATPHLLTPATAPIAQLHAGELVVALDAGVNHTCAVYASGSLVCWGAGGSGRLGSGGTASIGLSDTPAAAPAITIPSGRSALQVAAGDQHTCALMDDGGVLCWGEGDNGRLGYGDTEDKGHDSSSTPEQLLPVMLPDNRSAVSVSAGAAHTCAVLEDGSLVCWGEGAHGQLGYGNTTDIGDDETPADAGTVRMPHDALVASVSAGDSHTCATLRVGAIVCWGASPNGELGRGSNATMGAAPWLQPGRANSLAYPVMGAPSNVSQHTVPSIPPACSPSVSPTVSSTPSHSPTVSTTPSTSGSVTPTISGTPTGTPSPSVSGTPLRTPSPTVSGTPLRTPSPTVSGTPLRTPSPSVSGMPQATTATKSTEDTSGSSDSESHSGESSFGTPGPVIGTVLLVSMLLGSSVLLLHHWRKQGKHRARAVHAESQPSSGSRGAPG